MESKPNFAKVHGPWWTQIKVVLIQKGLMDNQNPGFCMGWPGLYLLDNIDQLGTVCIMPIYLDIVGQSNVSWPGIFLIDFECSNMIWFDRFDI